MRCATSETEAVWGKFHAGLLRHIARRVQDREVAKDILQEVFMRVHTRIGTVRDDRRIAGWIYRIAHNAIVDHYRARRSGCEADDLLAAPGTEDPASALAPALLPMIERLPEVYRSAVRAVEIDGCSQVDIARANGLAISTVKSRVRRGRGLLKQMLLECCHIELGRRGGIVSYALREDCCETKNRRQRVRPREARI